MWAESIDQRTGRTYYYHILTSERTFERPSGAGGAGGSKQYDKRKPDQVVTDDDDDDDMDDIDPNENYRKKKRYSSSRAGDSTTAALSSSSISHLHHHRPPHHQEPYAFYTDEYRLEKEEERKRKKEKQEKKKKKKKQKKDKKKKKKKKREGYGEDDASLSSSFEDDDDDDEEEESSEGSPDDRRRRKNGRSSRSSKRKSSKEQMDLFARPSITTADHTTSSSSRRKRSKSKSSERRSTSRTRTRTRSSRHHPPDDALAKSNRSKSTTTTTSKRPSSRGGDAAAPAPATPSKSTRNSGTSSSSNKKAAKLSAQLEQARHELEERKRALRKREKELQKERINMAEERRQEEEARKLQAALDEQARRQAFEEEEDKRQQLIRMETRKQVAAVEEQARRVAREAEEARRKAEEEAELARQRAAELDVARLHAEKEAELAKKRASLQEEARREALQQVQQVRQEADQEKKGQAAALKEAALKMAAAEEKQIEAERKALVEEQARLKEELKRQELEESIRVADLANNNSSANLGSKSMSDGSSTTSGDEDDDDESDDESASDSESESGSSSGSEESLSSSVEEGELMDEADSPPTSKEGTSTSYPMEDSIDLTDLLHPDDDDNVPDLPAPKTKAAREKKRLLESKYSGSGATASTKNSSGTRNNSSGLPSRDTSYQNSHQNSTSIMFTGGNDSRPRDTSYSNSHQNSTSVTFAGGNESRYRRARSPMRREISSLNGSNNLSPHASPRKPVRSLSPTRSPTKGRQGVVRSNSMDPSRRMDLARMNSKPGMGNRQASIDFRTEKARNQMVGFNPHESRLGPVRGMSRAQSQVAGGRGMMTMMGRTQSGRGMGDRAKSMAPLRRADSTNRPGMMRGRSRGSFDNSFSKYDPHNSMSDIERPPPPVKKKKKESEYEKPPKSLVLIWLAVAGELGFDMGTTVIAFRSLTQEDDCCGEPINLGPVPMSITAPFFLLVSAELALLIRAILLTLFPNLMNDTEEDETDHEGNLKVRSTFMRWLCCCFRWKVRVIMRFLGFLVLLNPFFGCFIAWILLYQSSKRESFMVLGFEGGALLLHYLSVYLEGGIHNCWEFLMQGLLPLVPFVVGVGLVLFYLKQGGVCYIVEDSIFSFNGCEVCADGYPPVDGVCYFPNGTTYDFQVENALRIDKVTSLDDLMARTYQVSYCAYENPGGPEDVNFCFFDYDTGKLDGVVSNETSAPTPKPMYSTNKCGGTVGVGDRLSQCRKYLWNPTKDETMHCFTFGGPGDPCHLSMDNDGQNQGRFKDPSKCVIEQVNGEYRAYGDTFYLWNEPDKFERSYQWAGNSWLAYSSSRWLAEIGEMRSGGVQVATPMVKYDNPEQVRAQMQEFFDGCKPNCLDPADPSYIDVLSINLLCDPDEGSCEEKVATVTRDLAEVSQEFDSRPVHITQWGVPDTEVPFKLSRAMQATPGFFAEGSPVSRVYWYGGDSADGTNLAFRAVEGQDKSLGEVWADTCNSIPSQASSQNATTS